jgi:hypothetical protein
MTHQGVKGKNYKAVKSFRNWQKVSLFNEYTWQKMRRKGEKVASRNICLKKTGFQILGVRRPPPVFCTGLELAARS